MQFRKFLIALLKDYKFYYSKDEEEEIFGGFVKVMLGDENYKDIRIDVKDPRGYLFRIRSLNFDGMQIEGKGKDGGTWIYNYGYVEQIKDPNYGINRMLDITNSEKMIGIGRQRIILNVFRKEGL